MGVMRKKEKRVFSEFCITLTLINILGHQCVPFIYVELEITIVVMSVFPECIFLSAFRDFSTVS